AQVKTPETMALETLRMIQVASTREPVVRVEVGVPAEVAEYLLNRKRREIVALEESGQRGVNIRGINAAAPEHLEMVCLERKENEVRVNQPEPLPYRPRR